jgi:hypothetical protein
MSISSISSFTRYTYQILVTEVWDARKVLEPEATGDANDGEGGGDDDKILVISALTARGQELVLGTARQSAHMKTVQREVVRVIHIPHRVILRGKMIHSRYLPPELVDGADVRDSPHAAAVQTQQLHVLILQYAGG